MLSINNCGNVKKTDLLHIVKKLFKNFVVLIKGVKKHYLALNDSRWKEIDHKIETYRPDSNFNRQKTGETSSRYDKQSSLSRYAEDLIKELKKPGDVMVLDYCDGRHNAILLMGDDKKVRYFSYGADRLKHLNDNDLCGDPTDREGIFKLQLCLKTDMHSHGDTLFTLSNPKEKNYVLLHGANTEEMLKVWQEESKKPFSLLNHNCARVTRKILEAGFFLEGNGFFMEVPYMTTQLARTIPLSSQEQLGRKKLFDVLPFEGSDNVLS